MIKEAQWQWQKEGTSWKGVGIYHVTLTVMSREPLLGTLVIPVAPSSSPVAPPSLSSLAPASSRENPLRSRLGDDAYYALPPLFTEVLFLRPQPLRIYMNGCVLTARQGTMMVSPFISPQGKAVKEVLIKEQHPFIVLADNGFRDYYKPPTDLFDAVAAGRVLLLSPWEYDAGKRHISRAECVALNTMADEIATM